MYVNKSHANQVLIKSLTPTSLCVTRFHWLLFLTEMVQLSRHLTQAQVLVSENYKQLTNIIKTNYKIFYK